MEKIVLKTTRMTRLTYTDIYARIKKYQQEQISQFVDMHLFMLCLLTETIQIDEILFQLEHIIRD